MKKYLSMALAMLLVLGMFSALPAVAEQAELVTVKYVIPGDAPTGHDRIMPMVNEKLAERGIQLSLQYIPWDVWDQKLNLMLSTGEEFDLFHVMQDRVNFASYYSRGGLSDITDAIAQEGANIARTIPENVMEATKIGGRNYIIPTNWIELGIEGTYTVRKDLVEKYGQTEPTTPDEIKDTVEAILNQWDGDETPYLTFRGGEADPLSLHTTSLHPAYDRYPFTIKDKLFFVAQDGTVESWIETEEFKKDAEWMHDAYQRGLIDPDVLTITNEQISDSIARGVFVYSFGTGGNYAEMVQYVPEITPEDVVLWRLNPEKGTVRPYAFKNGNAVPSSSKNPAAAIRFIDWLYTSQENYDLFMYGEEGYNYTAPEARKIERLDSDINFPEKWQFADWMIGNMEYIRISAGGFPAIDNARYNVDETAQNSIAGGFFFDASEVQAEYSNVLTEYAAAIVPICLGVQDYDTYFPVALEKLKAAGLEKVVDAYKTQFAAYLEATK